MNRLNSVKLSQFVFGCVSIYTFIVLTRPGRVVVNRLSFPQSIKLLRPDTMIGFHEIRYKGTLYKYPNYEKLLVSVVVLVL